MRVLPFSVHLLLDCVSGLLLAFSPWLFGFADRVWVPHVVLGLLELGVVALTRTAASAVRHHPTAPAML